MLVILAYLRTSGCVFSVTPIFKQENIMNQCIKAIKNNNFDIAEEKLEMLEDSEVNIIVQQVYVSNVDMFNNLLCFADYTRNASKSFMIFKALTVQIKAGSKYGYKLRRLIRNLSKILYQPYMRYEKLENLIDSCTQLMVDETLKTMEHFLLSNKCCIDNEITELIDIMFIFDRELFKDVLDQVISKVYRKISINKLFLFTNNFTYLEQITLWYIVLYNNMDISDKLSSIMSDYVILIKRIMDRSEYSSIDGRIRSDLERVWKKLPNGIKYALTLPHVCLRTIEYDEPIYPYYRAEVPGSTNSPNFRKVFTWRPWGSNGKAYHPTYSWNFNRTNNGNPTVHIKNVEFNEYLFSGDLKFNYDKLRGNVFTEPTANEKSEWYLEPTIDYNYVYIKSYRHHYLYPGFDDLAENHDRRRVFTWLEGGTSFKEGIWEIFAC